MLHRHLPEKERADLLRWLKGDEIAADAIAQAIAISHVWDDLIDRDREPSVAEINNAFRYALVGLPRNPFWRQHQDEFSLLLEHAILDWHTSNALTGYNMPAAFVLRCSAASLIIRAAAIVGGFEWARQVSTEIRATHLDDYARFCAEHGEKNGLD